MMVALMKNGYCFMRQRYKIAVSPDFKIISILKFNKITITVYRKNARWGVNPNLLKNCIKPMLKSLKKIKKALKNDLNS